ncbi:IPTL-CTERM sorting domain-containing protein [Ottowia sp. SB7-C50]|uniref:IPTL-CTERM sorting domain-containing protein n=1 Tax=Ottowia sp. SB7-C50 TaxID=3081231 RepID=UPI002952C247|nr:IPTL-CTERM sorting domain-containing protein [Ottowia sp. SB7-C50]WOP16529.1 IPTL-CTERM sorting domain-containing protein [Ottowia sp. SB7-C50]
MVKINPADGYKVGPNASATVAVNNDDGEVPVTAIPTLSQWALMLLSLGLIGGAWRQRRR